MITGSKSADENESIVEHEKESLDTQRRPSNQAIIRMQAEIESLRAHLSGKGEVDSELNDLRQENAMLKRRIELLERTSTEKTDIDVSSR
jgi:flagellar capping protein FliD